MTRKKLVTTLKAYQKSSKRREAYLRDFTEKMVYRTTKTENPETTKRMVRQVLKRTS